MIWAGWPWEREGEFITGFWATTKNGETRSSALSIVVFPTCGITNPAWRPENCGFQKEVIRAYLPREFQKGTRCRPADEGPRAKAHAIKVHGETGAFSVSPAT